jgi:hypothetical protein
MTSNTIIGNALLFYGAIFGLLDWLSDALYALTTEFDSAPV